VTKTYQAATTLIANCIGSEHCFYCGSPACVPLKLSSSFVEWWSMAFPESKWICKGCEWMLVEKRTIPGKDKLQKTRNYSWLIQEGKQTPYTKANKSEIAAMLRTPPEPPWAFAIAESGQKHLLYKTRVNVTNEPPHIVQLEGESVVYHPAELESRLLLARSVVAAVGHSRATVIDAGFAIQAGIELTESWQKVVGQPLTRLALFVTPGQKECQE
jgi:CRISPR type IV-associated protein Csf1